MKLLKKLLPAITVASTTAIVVPMVTSCGQTVLTNSKLDFTPDEHDPVEGGLSDEEAIKELCSNTKYLAQDIAYYAIEESIYYSTYIPFNKGHRLDSESFISKHDNAKYDFTTSIKNVSLSEAKATIDSKEVKGYLLSGEIIDEIKAKGDQKEVTKTGVTKVTVDYSQKNSISLKDIFVYVKWDDEYESWVIHLDALKSASTNWTFTTDSKTIEIVMTTFKDGHETTDRKDINMGDYESCQHGSDDVKNVIGSIDSYYLKNIKKKA